jgi:fatty-acyl-CoA synthase
MSSSATSTTLWDALTAGAAAGHGKLHCWTDSGFETTGWAQVSRDAELMTRGLRNAGVAPGERVAAILTNTPLTVRGILGVWLAGGTLASFPIPARGMALDEYIGQLLTFVEHLRPSAMFVDEAMVELLAPELRALANVRSWESVADSGAVPLAPPEPDDVCFVQYSSGSTSVPKGCMLTARSISLQLQMILDMIGARPGEDVDASWLPLSHDMGIFGNLLAPWVSDIDLVLSTPERFVFSPGTWFADVVEYEATYTCGTNTALALAARRQRSSGRLRGEIKLQTIILGAERIHWDTLEQAVAAFGPHGLAPEVLMPAYGLAEATLAVTATPAREAPRRLTVDALGLAEGRVDEVEPGHPSATVITSAGRPVTGVTLPGLESGALTQIGVRSPSLAEGYYGDAESTRERFHDGTFLTGDLGFGHDGHLYPVGRLDDVLAVGGRKVYAREIEVAIDAIEGMRAGCSTIIATGDGGTELLTLLIEVRRAGSDYRALAEQAADVAMAKAAVPLDHCLFLKGGSLPKTPSGKIQRYRCRQSLLDGRLTPLARVDLARA